MRLGIEKIQFVGVQERREETLLRVRRMLVGFESLSEEEALSAEIHRLPTGQPYIQFPPDIDITAPSLSISHSSSWLACVLSDETAPVCVDIEDMGKKRSLEKLADYAFSELEIRFVKERGAVGFYQLWTAKEAIAKCEGKGLSKALSIDLGDQLWGLGKGAFSKVQACGKDYHLAHTIYHNDLMCALAGAL